MKTAYIFPGQGSQYPGMGKDLYEKSETARQMFHQANDLLGFDLASVMFEGSQDDLTQTKVTQPAVFLHSVISVALIENFRPDMVAGHSLGEFSALVAAGVLAFEDALQLVLTRALAMQRACEMQPSAMAAVLGYPSESLVEEICASVTDEIVVPANYNAPGQLVISGSLRGVELATEKLKDAGVKRIVKLPVGGAFHSPLMEPARKELQSKIEVLPFKEPVCPIYQNVCACAVTDAATVQQNLISQLTAPVKWTQSVLQMERDGASFFKEIGPGNVLTGLVKKINPNCRAEKLTV
jgi:[acyl-carrier-protein] S-malonyltransferase